MFEATSFPRFNLYEALGLPPPGAGQVYTAEEIKAAYRRALLKHHPDKAKTAAADTTQSTGSKAGQPKFSVDDISRARDILIDAGLRREYNRHLTAQSDGSGHQGLVKPSLSGTGLETIDLEDMTFSEDTERYSRACRCGSDVGFQVSESELEAEADSGEVVVSCPGCSLSARIVFQVDEG